MIGESLKKIGLKEFLEEGDQVMAGWGFTIRDLTKKGVKLNMPQFTKGNQSCFCYP